MSDKFTYTSLGEKYGGPILVRYCLWLLNKSEKMGIKTLYFISRDGLVLKHIVDQLLRNLCIDIKTRYIYGSRISWRLNPVDLEKNLLINNFSNDSQWDFEVLNKLSARGFFDTHDDFKGKKISGYFLKSILFEDLLDEKFCNELKNLQHNKISLLLRYLDQEIHCDINDYAFVDIHGSGKTMSYLSKFLVLNDESKLKTFLCYKTESEIFDSCDFYVMMKKEHDNCDVVEMLCRAPNQQVIGYDDSVNIIRPIYDDWSSLEIMDYQYNDYVRGIQKFMNGELSKILEEDESLLKSKLVESMNEILYLKNQAFSSFFEQKNSYAFQFKGKKITNNSIISSYERIKDNIILYGAGKKGLLLFEQLNFQEKNIVKIVDKNYKNLKHLNVEIESPEKIVKYKFEQVIITITNPEVAFEVAKWLMDKGIKKEQLLWIIPNQDMY